MTKHDGDTYKKYCTLCHKHGHWKCRCPGQVCATCKGNGHSTNVCPSGKEDAVFADFHTDLDPEELLELDALVAETGENSQLNDTTGKQVVPFVADSGASRYAFPSFTNMFNYVECDRTVSTATGDTFLIEGYSDIRVELLSAVQAVRVVMENVAHVHTFKHNLCSVGAAAGQGHPVIFDKDACTLQLKSGTSVCFPKFGTLFFIQACPLPPPEHAFAVIAPGLTPTTSPVDINAYHCAHGHIHEALLRKTELALFWKGRCTNAKVFAGKRAPKAHFTVDTRPSS